jgi:hypothetical protein
VAIYPASVDLSASGGPGFTPASCPHINNPFLPFLPVNAPTSVDCPSGLVIEGCPVRAPIDATLLMPSCGGTYRLTLTSRFRRIVTVSATPPIVRYEVRMAAVWNYPLTTCSEVDNPVQMNFLGLFEVWRRCSDAFCANFTNEVFLLPFSYGEIYGLSESFACCPSWSYTVTNFSPGVMMLERL